MTPSSNIGHYKVTSKLGEGGMGAAYRATDTKLGRDVAIKILPPAFAEDTARMQRFEREAQVLASPNHPNIEREPSRQIFALHQFHHDGALLDAIDRGDTPPPHSLI